MEDSNQNVKGTSNDTEENQNTVSMEQEPEPTEQIGERKVIDNLPKEEKKAMSKKKKIVIISSIIFLIIVASIGGFFYWKVTSAQKYEENFELTLAVTQALIFDGTIKDVSICETYSTVWRNAIDSRYKDFNTELANQKSENQNDGTFSKSEDTKKSIDESMKKLNNPPSKYQKTYDKLLEMYGTYTKIHSQAMSPSVMPPLVKTRF